MRRISPERRKRIVHDLVKGLANTWICMHGRWSRDRLLLELEQSLRARRLAAKRKSQEK